MLRKYGVLLILAALLVSCSRITAVRGNFDVIYPSDVQFENFNKPIVVGSKLRLFVKQVGTDKALPIDSVEVKPPSRARVAEVTGDQFVLHAKKPGPFRLLIRVKLPNGDLAEDMVVMRVEKPQQVFWQHSCVQPGSPAVYPAPTKDVRIPFIMLGKHNAPMIGYGRQPVITEPQELAKIRATDDQSGLHLAAHRAGKGVLKSQISDQTLAIEFVERSAVDGVRLAAGQDGIATLVGSETLLVFEPLVGGVPMCGSRLVIQATSKNQHCRVTTAGDDGKPNRVGFVRVLGASYGVCEVQVTYAQANSGKGVSTTVRVPIGKMPGQSAAIAEKWWFSPLLALLAPLAFFPLLLWGYGRRRRRQT